MNSLIKTLCTTFMLLLTGCSGYTAVGGAPAYHHGLSDESGGSTFLIGADPSTFQKLKGDGYAKDKDHVYYRGRRIETAQSASFVALSDDYGRDSIRGFYQSDPIPGADGQTFEVLPRMWARDKNDVYAGTHALHACDAATFRNLKLSWHLDSQCLYVGQKKVAGVDSQTIQVVSSAYAKDAQHVYSDIGGLIPGADAASFRLINGKCDVCARDKDRCYLNQEVVSCDRFK